MTIFVLGPDFRADFALFASLALVPVVEDEMPQEVVEIAGL